MTKTPLFEIYNAFENDSDQFAKKRVKYFCKIISLSNFFHLSTLKLFAWLQFSYNSKIKKLGFKFV